MITQAYAGSEVDDLLARNNLDFMVAQLEEAIAAVEKIGPCASKGALDRKQVRKFAGTFRDYRRAGASALNHLNRVFASRVAKQHPGSETKTYLRLDAMCSHDEEGRRVASVLVPVKELASYVPVESGQFIDLDNPEVAQGATAYLQKQGIRPNQRIYSHLEEVIEGSNAFCGNHLAPFVPVSTVRIVVDSVSPSQRRDAEKAIVRDYAMALKGSGMIRGNGGMEEALRADLEELLNVGEEGYPDLYSVFEHTHFFSPVLWDVIRMRKPGNLAVIKFFETANGRKPGKRAASNNGYHHELAEPAIEQLEGIIKEHISVPHEVFEYGVKSPASFARKFLLNQLYLDIKAGFEDGSLNAYLGELGFPKLVSKDVAMRRDLRDFHRMARILHGPESYNATGSEPVPKQQQELLSRCYDNFFGFAEIQPEFRSGTDSEGEPRWRQLGPRITEDGLVVNPSSRADVKDYIRNRKPTNFAQLKVYAGLPAMTRQQHSTRWIVPFEVQFMTNYMDTRNRLSQDAQHELFKKRNAAIVQYCIEIGAISQGRVDALNFVLGAAL